VSVCGFVVPFFCLYIFLTCAFAFVLSRCDSVPCGQVLVLDLYDKKNMAKKRVTRQLKVCHLNTQRGWSAERGGACIQSPTHTKGMGDRPKGSH
jgi:hypothetical protein